MKVSQWKRTRQGEDHSRQALVVIALLLGFGLYRMVGLFAVETTLKGEGDAEVQLVNASALVVPPAAAVPGVPMAAKILSGTQTMQMVVEQGLGATRTKMGAGEKEEAYAMKASRAKAFMGGILVTLLVLAVLAGSYAALFNDERMRRVFQARKQMQKTGEQKEATVRLGFEIQKQESEREEQERDTMRSFKRISSVVDRKFTALLADPALIGVGVAPTLKTNLETLRREILDYVNEELVDFEKERAQYDKESQKRLQRLASMQEQSMRELLRSVSGVKMEALMEMLEEVFSAANKAPAVHASPAVLAQLEELADGMYEEKVSLADGRAQFEKLRGGIVGDVPSELVTQMSNAREADEFAEALDSLAEVARLASGREDLAIIEKKWRQDVEKAGEHYQRLAARAEKLIADGRDPLDAMPTDQEYYDEEVQANVEAILAVHKLVSEGKVPLHLMDFETMELTDSDNDGVPDVEEDEAHKEKEKAAESASKAG